MEWEKVGSIGVDSGQMLLSDPCYLGEGSSVYHDCRNFDEQVQQIAGGIV